MGLMALSRSTNDPRPRSMALWILAGIESLDGDYPLSIEHAEESLRISLSPLDRSAALLNKACSMVLAGRVAEGVKLGEPTIEIFTGSGSTFNVSTAKMVIGAGRLQQGEMAIGMRKIIDAAQEPIKWGQSVQRAWVEALFGEIYLELAIGNEKPSFSVIIKNLPFLIRTLPFAKSRARNHLQNAVDLFRKMDCPGGIARCLIVLAKLDIAGMKNDLARQKLNEAREIAVSVDALAVVRDVDAELARL